MCTVVEVGIRLYFIRVFDKVDFMIILRSLSLFCMKKIMLQFVYKLIETMFNSFLP